MYQIQCIIAWQKPYLLQQNKKMWLKILITQLFATAANDNHVLAILINCHDLAPIATIFSVARAQISSATRVLLVRNLHPKRVLQVIANPTKILL